MRAKKGDPSSSSRVKVEPSEPLGLSHRSRSRSRSRSRAELSGLMGLCEKAMPGLLISGTPAGALVLVVGDESASQMELMLVEGDGSLSNTHRVS